MLNFTYTGAGLIPSASGYENAHVPGCVEFKDSGIFATEAYPRYRRTDTWWKGYGQQLPLLALSLRFMQRMEVKNELLDVKCVSIHGPL